jgi:hypothetical protein
VADKEFFSFEEALSELRLKEEELKRLVSEGEIRAFREGDTMKLRKQDVASLRSELTGGEVVDLGGVSEELVFEDDADLDAGMATEEIADIDTILEDDVEELDLDEDEEPEPRRSRRSAAPAVIAAAPEPEESMLDKVLLIVTALVLFLGVPVGLSLATHSVSDIAKSIAGIFATMPQ